MVWLVQETCGPVGATPQYVSSVLPPCVCDDYLEEGFEMSSSTLVLVTRLHRTLNSFGHDEVECVCHVLIN